MGRTSLIDFGGGLWISGPVNRTPKGNFRRFRGVHQIRTSSLRSRNGTTQLFALDAHSLHRFNDLRFQGAGSVLYRDGVSAQTGLTGTGWSFVRMPPVSGVKLSDAVLADYLFVAGAGNAV